MKAMRRASTVQSLERGLAVLDAVAADGEPIGISDLARKLGLAKGSVARLAATLVKLDYLAQSADSRKYRLGLKLWYLGSQSIAGLGVVEAARPVMKELQEETGETVHLTILSGDGHMVFLDKLDSNKGLRPNIEIGAHLPLHCVANGKAVLALLPRQRVNELLARKLPRFTDATITSRAALAEALAVVRQAGYAVNRGEYRSDVAGVAAAIVNSGGQPVAALGISLPSLRMSDTEAVRLGLVVAAKARKISALLGSRQQPVLA